MSKKIDTLCPIPWSHLSVGSKQNIRLCYACSDDGQFISEGNSFLKFNNKYSVSELRNNRLFRDVRTLMLDGQWPSTCLYCKKIEELNAISPRLIAIRNLQACGGGVDYICLDDGKTNSELVSCHISLSTLCNLSCRMCDPYYSSGLIDKWEQLNIVFDRQEAEQLKQGFRLNEHVEQITEILQKISNLSILGGETFINPEYKKILKLAIDLGVSKNIILHSSTNGTVLPKDIINLWKHFKGIILYISLEGVKEFNEYIRFPSKWSTIEKNLLLLKKLTYVMPLKFQIHTVFQAYSLLKLPETINYLYNLLGADYAVPHILYLDDKPGLMVDVLPKNIKKKIKKDILMLLKELSLENSENAQLLIAHLKMMPTNTTGEFANFFHYTRRWDKLTNTSFLQHFPELRYHYKIYLQEMYFKEKSK